MGGNGLKGRGRNKERVELGKRLKVFKNMYELLKLGCFLQLVLFSLFFHGTYSFCKNLVGNLAQWESRQEGEVTSPVYT